MSSVCSPVFIGIKSTGILPDAEIISLALTDPDGNSLYLELEFDDSKVQDDWVKDNIIPNLQGCARHSLEVAGATVAEWLEHTYGHLRCAVAPVLDRGQYDWVLFCRIFGGDLPRILAPYPLDLHTLFWAKGVDPGVSREDFIGERFAGYGYSALWDSWVVWKCFDKLRRGDYEVYDTESLLNFGRGYFDYTRAKRGVDYSAKSDLYEAQAQWLDRHVISFTGKRVLDIGCAMGMSLVPLRSLGASVVGADVSQWAVRNSPVRDLVPLLAANGCALPFQECCFDIVRCHGVLEHLSQDVADGVVKESFRVLRDGGLFCGLLTTKHWPGDDLTHINIRAMGEWEEIFAYVGFEIVHKELPTHYAGVEMIGDRENGWLFAIKEGHSEQ